MKLVLDACVAIASVRPQEPHHRASRRRVERALAYEDLLILPTLFSVEVAGSLSRVHESSRGARSLLRSLLQAPHELSALGPKRAARVAKLASACRLRAADAWYVWLAAEHGVPLCTLDEEVHERASSVCTVIHP